MAIVRTDIAASLEYGVKDMFLSGRNAWPSTRSLVSNEEPSTGASETYVGLGEAPFPSESIDEAEVKGLNERSITITNRDFHVTIGISHNAINDDRVGHVLRWAQSAGGRFEQHKDKRVYQALNGGDGSTYGLCYDGKDYFDNDHADASAEYVTAQSNEGALPLTINNFNATWILAKALRDARGELIDIPFNLITCHPTLLATAVNITNNVNAYDTANNEINPFANMFLPPNINPHMDASAWILTSTLLADRPIILQIRQEPVLTIWDNNMVVAGGGRRFYQWKSRLDVGYGDWRNGYQGNT